MFGDELSNNDEELILKIDDWKFEERLSKEFEAVGFFISDHPLNQFKDTFDDYNITDYQEFSNNDLSKESNISATLLKLTERKTAKGTPYGVIKLTDLNSVFELFIFSDTLEFNREILKEGNSLLLTLVKTISNDENKTKRINVQKIASLKDLINKPISEVLFKITSPNQLEKISNLLAENGKTNVNIEFDNGENKMFFKLENPRNLDRKTLNLIKNQQIQAEIS